jgi:hypothetical protein
MDVINISAMIWNYTRRTEGFIQSRIHTLSVSARIANLSIRTKIVFSFMTVLALLAGLGLNALQRSSAMNSTVGDLTRNYALAVVYLDEMRVSVAEFRGALARQLLQFDDRRARTRRPRWRRW